MLRSMAKNRNAVALGRLGGKARAELPAEVLSEINRPGAKAGGKARAAKLSGAQRKKIASAAAKARWAKNKTTIKE
jgi:hypothetical protein